MYGVNWQGISVLVSVCTYEYPDLPFLNLQNVFKSALLFINKIIGKYTFFRSGWLSFAARLSSARYMSDLNHVL